MSRQPLTKKLTVLGICDSLRQQSTNLDLLEFARDSTPAGIEIEDNEAEHVTIELLYNQLDIDNYTCDLKQLIA